MGYETKWQVRFGEVDRAGVIYYPVLFDNIHRGVEDLFQEAGFPFDEILSEGLGLPIVHAEADYLNPIQYGDTVELTITPLMGDSSIAFTAIGRIKDTVFRAVEKHVIINQDTFEKRPVPTNLREALSPYTTD